MIKKLTDRVIISVFQAIKNMIFQQEWDVSCLVVSLNSTLRCFMLGSLHRMMVIDFHREKGGGGRERVHVPADF